jgi:REP element-mobilizing transposase RayT
MPRIPRGESSEGIYHIINRGNMRMQVFNDAEDYEYFLSLLEQGAKKESVSVHAYCLMPNHFHLLLSPKQEGSLSRMMQWVMTSHVRYYHRKNKTSGHVWQGRYKSFIVQQDDYYAVVMKYVEASALRTKLVKKPKIGCMAHCMIDCPQTKQIYCVRRLSNWVIDLSTLFGTKNSHNPQIFYATFDFSSSHHLISASIGER